MAGIRLRFVGTAGILSTHSEQCSDHAICQRLRSSKQGIDHCNRYIEELILDTKPDQLSCNRCDAGLTNFCYPLRLNGDTLGYLVTGGYAVGPIEAAAKNRLRHLLGRRGVKDMDAALREFEEATLVVNAAKHEALKRWLQMAASALLRSLELGEDASERPLPSYIVKICSIVQTRYQEPPSLPDAAQICKLSEGYFCRAFHTHTGLRYLEYIQAVRIEHFIQILNSRPISITDAAFDVGFNSISQFNRVFKKHKGKSPRQWRNEACIQSLSP